MDTIVDRIRYLSKISKTSITKIEEELGYANGTIGKWKNAKRKPPLEKVTAIAERLGTTSEFLYTGKKEKPPAQGEGQIHTIEDWDRVLTGLSKDELRKIMDIVMRKFTEQN